MHIPSMGEEEGRQERLRGEREGWMGGGSGSDGSGHCVLVRQGQ